LLEIYYQVSKVIVKTLAQEEGKSLSLKSNDLYYFFKKMLDNDNQDTDLVQFSLKCNLPLIAVGAPVKAYFPEISKRLNTDLILPDYAEVANAVGTVGGEVIEHITVMIKPGDGGGFLVHTPLERKFFKKLKDAVSYAKNEGENIAVKRAESSKASNIETKIIKDDKYSDYLGQSNKNKDDKIFIESRLTITAIGKPW
ncbi:MAG: hydantoinase/oxoprolinase family protein, partial [Halanaerobiales bacterium]|nr:hydantoinase/oxoprolinase family protein [Halanaerobiales bacterium]